MGNTASTSDHNVPQQIDEFTSAFVSAELSDKHTRLVQSASKLLRLSDVPFSVERLHQETQKLLSNNIEVIRREVPKLAVAPAAPSATAATAAYRYYFSKDSNKASLLLEKTPDGPLLTAEYPLECIISRKVCIRVLGLVLSRAIKPPFQFRRQAGFLCTLRMPAPVQINVLIALAALGVFIKFQKGMDRGREDGRKVLQFKLSERWPSPILPQMDPEALQFRCVFSDSHFLHSQYNLVSNRFEWRKKTSYRYRELAYLKRMNLLNQVPATEDLVESMKRMDLVKQRRTIYVEMPHINQPSITICFVGAIIDFIRKYDLLPDGSKGKRQLMSSKIHSFPLEQDMLVAKMKEFLNKSDGYTQTQKFNWRIVDLLRMPELGLRNLLKFLSIVQETGKDELPIYDPHYIVDGNASPDIQLQQRYLVLIQQLSEQVLK
jgi:hypothetical protein